MKGEGWERVKEGREETSEREGRRAEGGKRVIRERMIGRRKVTEGRIMAGGGGIEHPRLRQ